MAGDKELRVKLIAEADTDKAEDFAEVIEEIPEKVETELAVDAGDSRHVVEGVLDGLDKLAKADTTVVAKVKVDDAALANARRGMDDLKGSAGSTVGPLRDVSGAFGGVGQGALDAGDALIGFGETIGALSPKLAGFGASLGKIGFVGAAAALGVGVVQEVVKAFQAGSERIAKAAEDMSKRVVAAQGDVDKAFQERAMENWSDAMIDRLTDVGLTFDDVAKSAKGKFTPAVQGIADVLGSIEPNASAVTKELEAWAASMGLTTDEALRLIPVMNDVAGDLETEGVALSRSSEAWQDRSRFFGDAIRAQDDAAASMRGLGDGMRGVDRATLDYAAAQAEAARQTGEHAHNVDTLTASLQAVNAEIESQRDAILSLPEARTAALEAEARFLELQKEGKASTDELAASAIALAEAHAIQEEAQAKANGETVNAETKQASLIESLEATAAQASGPTKDAIMAVVDSLKKVPPTADTTMTVNNAEALRKLNEQIRLMQIIRDTADSTVAALRAVPGGAGGAILGQSAPITQNITVNAGFGTDAFAVRSAVLSSARQAARLTQNAVKFVR